MLVSAVQNNDCGYVDLQDKNILFELNEESVNHFHEDHMLVKGNAREKENLKNVLAFNEYCELLLNRYKISNLNVLTDFNVADIFNENSDRECYKSGEIKKPHKKATVELELDCDDGNNSVKMDMKNDKSYASDDRSYPNRFCSEVSRNLCSPVPLTQLDYSNCSNMVNSTKINSNTGLPTTSGNTSKMCISTDEDPNFDIFDLKCSDDEVTNCDKSFCDKDELTLNEDLVNKYEKNLGLDIVRNKDICWAAGNLDLDLCPLENYDSYNENSLLSFARDSFDGDSHDSFSQEWTFGESIDYVSQEQVPDPHVIVPKKAVDITKIKGWRKKQFTVEKCLANRNSVLKKTNAKLNKWKEVSNRNVESDVTRDNDPGEDQNKDYAFVCDKLDDFLDQEAELKINYEIPHLYAEYGIKLTSEELVSRPKFNLSTVNKRLPTKNVKAIVPVEKRENGGIASYENVKIEEKPISRSSSLIKKPSPKLKCAFPNKTHKNWILWKESNLSRGKPNSLIKKEVSVNKVNVTEVAQPCRRSGRISQAALNKSSGGSYPAVSSDSDRVSTPPVESDPKSANAIVKPDFDFGADYKFQIRKFGMVLYPGPSAPLNPFITYHLRKIRSYRTLIDRKWANFAVSAVVQKGETPNRKRMVLPLTCCFKYKSETGNPLQDALAETESKDIKCVVGGNDEISGGEKDAIRDGCDEITVKAEVGEKRSISVKRRESATRLALTRKINDGKLDLYEEEVKCGEDSKDEIDLINSATIDYVSDNMNYFSDDSNFDSDKCDIVFEKRRSKTSISRCIKENLRNSPEVIDIEDEGTEFNSTVGLSSDSNQTTFNKTIAKMLTKKLNELKQTDSVTSSIDNLKTVKPNVLELIKLNFIKENYLSGYINLWYLKSPETGKSRIFLTFSMNPPVDGAINLKMMSRCPVSDPPNIIQEIIAKDKLFDPNDFAILYCEGNHWEIHGSVNFVVKNCGGEREENEKIQVFHLTKKVFQELEMLHDIKPRSDKNKVVKWWVMHMMQDYTEITIRCGDQVGRISRSIIIKTWKTKVPSFIEFKGLRNDRPIGVGVNPRLWPYFLIGPYQMGDHHNLTLKLNSKIIPFEYYLPLDRVKPAFLLKRFVSSVIMHSWRNYRQVVGMWLYDRIAMKQGSFIQVRTRVKKSGNYEPAVEHDYSLSKSSDGLFEPKADYNKKVPEKSKSESPREVFLVPDIPHLGYIKGERNADQSITIEHPLKPERKRNSHRIGDWLNRIMKKRVKFIPSDFYVKWKVVENAELVRNLEPFNRSSLGGAHILCNKGIFYLLSLSKEKIQNLGLDESVVMDAILNNPIIQEVSEVKELGKILLKKDTCDLPMADILQMALAEIEKLEKKEKQLKKSRDVIERKRELLCSKFLEALENCEVDENSKRAINFYVTGILESCKNGGEKFGSSNKEKENCRRLEAINKFLKGLNFPSPQENCESRVKNELQKEKDYGKDAPSKILPKGTQEENRVGGEERSDNDKLQELESKIKSLHESLNKMNGDDVNLRQLLTKRLNAMSQHLEKMKRNHNANGKLSPVIDGRTDCSGTERSPCRISSQLNGPIDGKSETPGSGPLETVEIRPRKKEDRPPQEELINEKCDSKVDSCADSITSVPEKARREKTRKALYLLKKYVEEPTTKAEEDAESDGDFPVNEFVEVAANQLPKEIGSLEKSSKLENVGVAIEEIKSEEREVEMLGNGTGKAVFREDETLFETCKISSIGGNAINRQKPGGFKLIRKISFSDGKTRKRLRSRIDYMDMLTNGKQVLLVNRKRKGGGNNDFIKKLKRS